MTESTLSLTRTQLREEIGHFLGYKRTTSAWSTSQIADIDAALNKGLRQFYFPPKITPADSAHRWSFLKPIDTLVTIDSYDTGTISVNDSSATVTLATGTWPSWTATHGTLVISTVEYAIATRDSDAQITLTTNYDGDGSNLSGGSYTLRHDGNYDMDDDFGGIVGEMTFGAVTQYQTIKVVGEGQIRQARQQISTRARPQFVAIRPKESDGTDGQRYEAMFYPVPGAVYTLSFRKRILVDALTATIKNPYGGMEHSETILASCIAAAELQSEDTKSVRWDEFMERLSASVDGDRKAYSQDFYGYNSDNSDIPEYGIRNETVVTVNGEVPR